MTIIEIIKNNPKSKFIYCRHNSLWYKAGDLIFDIPLSEVSGGMFEAEMDTRYLKRWIRPYLNTDITINNTLLENTLTEEYIRFLGKEPESPNYFKGDIIITDPCYIDTEADILWNSIDPCEDNPNLTPFGFTKYLWSSTIYGDWSCTTLVDTPETKVLLTTLNNKYLEMWNCINGENIDPEIQKQTVKDYEVVKASLKASNIILGEFCADAGLVGVFYLDEVLKFNPKFDYHITRPHTTTLIKNFDGFITLENDGEGVKVVGKGNINFYTTQTGF